MRLCRIRIENFGKLSEYELEFNNNPYIIIEDNGWGKSTLATFIRVMFYGFSGDAARSVVTNERKRYTPWNKGVFGGSIVFETGGRKYEINRVFGNRSSGDTIKIRDYETGLESSDFKADKLGEQLFGIDSEAFSRTVFIAQNRTANSALGSGIHARIGSLTHGTDDVHNYDKVMEDIKNHKLALKSGSKKGKVNEINAVISKLEAEQIKSASVDRQLEECTMGLSARRKEAEDIRAQILQLDDEMKVASQLGERQAKRDHYLNLKNDIDQLEVVLRDSMPACRDEGELDEMIKVADRTRQLHVFIEENSDCEAVNIQCTDKETVDENIRLWKKRNSMLARVTSMQVSLNSMKQMDAMRRESIENNNARKREEFNRERDRIRHENIAALRKRKLAENMVMITGMLLSIISVVTYFVLGTMAHIWVAGLAVAALAISIVMRGADRNDEYEESCIEPEFETYVVDGRITECQNEIDKLLLEADEYEKKVKLFFDSCDKTYDEDMVEGELYRMLAQVDETKRNSSKADRYREAVTEIADSEAMLREFFDKYKLSDSEDRTAVLQEQKSIIRLYGYNRERYDKKVEELENYLTSLDFDPGDTETITGRKLEEIAVEKEELNNRLETVSEEILELRRQLDECTVRRQAMYEDEIQLKENKNHVSKLISEYDIIVKVEEHMAKAKNRLTAKYKDPILDAFSKYYGFIQETDLDLYDIDSDINITRRETGDKRGMETMSRGYAELVDVALRMALADAMYDGEKPFIIMDDPFVNLDTVKLNHCSDFMKEVAKDYQVIYFTCHESRAFI